MIISRIGMLTATVRITINRIGVSVNTDFAEMLIALSYYTIANIAKSVNYASIAENRS